MNAANLSEMYLKDVLGLSDFSRQQLRQKSGSTAPVTRLLVLHTGSQEASEQELLHKMIKAMGIASMAIHSKPKWELSDLKDLLTSTQPQAALVVGEDFHKFASGQIGQWQSGFSCPLMWTYGPEQMTGTTDGVKERKRMAWTHMQQVMQQLNQ